MARAGVKIIHKKKGMKSLVKKLVFLQQWNATAGIHKNEGRRKVIGEGGKRKRINIATLASIMEKYVSWIQGKNKVIHGASGESSIVLKAGRRYNKPIRIFIKLQYLSGVWKSLRDFIRASFKAYLNNKSAKANSGRRVFERIGRRAEFLQASQIAESKTEKNSLATAIIKGFNHPLFDKGRLLRSIKSKVKSDMNGKGKAHKAQKKLKYINEIDSVIRRINGK